MRHVLLGLFPPQSSKNIPLCFTCPSHFSVLKVRIPQLSTDFHITGQKIACMARMLIMVTAMLSTASTCPKATCFFCLFVFSVSVKYRHIYVGEIFFCEFIIHIHKSVSQLIELK